MLRREFLQGSAIVGASLVLPRILRASSGMWAEGGERKIAKVLTARSTMVQNTPVIRSFAGNHTDLVSPWVMLDEFGPMRVEPGTLGMDIQAHPHAGVTPTTYLISGSGRHTDSLANDIVYRKGEFMLFSSAAAPSTKKCPATNCGETAARCTVFRFGSTPRPRRNSPTPTP